MQRALEKYDLLKLIKKNNRVQTVTCEECAKLLSWFYYCPSRFQRSLRLLEVRQHAPSAPTHTQKNLRVEPFYRTHRSRLIWSATFGEKKLYWNWGPSTSAKTHYATWWIINKIKMNLRSTLKHPHFILHTAWSRFKQTPQQWFRQRKPLPEGELCVSEVSPQRPLCFRHPYIRSRGRAAKALPNISFSRLFLCSLKCRYGTCSASFKDRERWDWSGWEV